MLCRLVRCLRSRFQVVESGWRNLRCVAVKSVCPVVATRKYEKPWKLCWHATIATRARLGTASNWLKSRAATCFCQRVDSGLLAEYGRAWRWFFFFFFFFFFPIRAATTWLASINVSDQFTRDFFAGGGVSGASAECGSPRGGLRLVVLVRFSPVARKQIPCHAKPAMFDRVKIIPCVSFSS